MIILVKAGTALFSEILETKKEVESYYFNLISVIHVITQTVVKEKITLNTNIILFKISGFKKIKAKNAKYY